MKMNKMVVLVSLILVVIIIRCGVPPGVSVGV